MKCYTQERCFPSPRAFPFVVDVIDNNSKNDFRDITVHWHHLKEWKRSASSGINLTKSKPHFHLNVPRPSLCLHQPAAPKWFPQKLSLPDTLQLKNQKVQLTEGSRPHHSINGNSTRTPVAKELNYNLDTHKSTGRIKAVEKEACNTESNRKKEMELLGSVSKSESVPEVEALLARLRAL